jgi:carbon starvation protein CstA
MSKGKNYQWTIWPFAFMFITTIGALLYKAYEAFFRNLPNATANAEKAKLTVAQYTTAQIIIGAVAVILIVAAFILAWDGLQAIRRFRAQAAAPAKAGGGE